MPLTDHKGKVVTVRRLIDDGCTRSIILEMMLKRRDLDVSINYGTPLNIKSMAEFLKQENVTSELLIPGYINHKGGLGTNGG